MDQNKTGTALLVAGALGFVFGGECSNQKNLRREFLEQKLASVSEELESTEDANKKLTERLSVLEKERHRMEIDLFNAQGRLEGAKREWEYELRDWQRIADNPLMDGVIIDGEYWHPNAGKGKMDIGAVGILSHVVQDPAEGVGNYITLEDHACMEISLFHEQPIKDIWVRRDHLESQTTVDRRYGAQEVTKKEGYTKISLPNLPLELGTNYFAVFVREDSGRWTRTSPLDNWGFRRFADDRGALDHSIRAFEEAMERNRNSEFMVDETEEAVHEMDRVFGAYNALVNGRD